MRTVAEIKEDILALPEADYAELMVWLDELCESKWNEWDRQIEADSKAGKLDSVMSLRLRRRYWKQSERENCRSSKETLNKNGEGFLVVTGGVSRQ